MGFGSRKLVTYLWVLWHLGHNQIIAQEQEPIDLQEIHVLSAVFKIDGCHFVSQSVP